MMEIQFHTKSIDLVRFAMRDIAFNLVPENVFVAPFQRFQTSLVNGTEPGVRGKVVVGIDVVELGNQGGQLEVDAANVHQDPVARGGEEVQFEGKLVDGANVLGLVAAAAALGTAAALRKEEDKLVVEVISSPLSSNEILSDACRSAPAWPPSSPCCSKQPFATSVRLAFFPWWRRRY